MTIYTPSLNEKDNAKDKLVPEVVTEPLTGCKDDLDETETAPKSVRVTYFPRSHRRFSFYFSIGIALLVILACGITGGVVFYRHMTKKVYSFRCGTTFYDEQYHRKLNEEPKALPVTEERHQMDSVQEDIEVSEVEMYEQIHTPKFDEVMESFVLHEFRRNHTTIVDHTLRRCFIMKLNRTAIAPPTDLIDLVKKLMSGYYLPKARVLRETYVSTYEALSNLEPFGPRVMQSCRFYPTFWVEKRQYKGHLFDDFVFDQALEDIMYAMLSNRREDMTLFKFHIQSLTKGRRPPAAPAA